MKTTIDYLTFCNYCTQRNRFPNIAPERWAKVFKGQEILEKLYQKTLTKFKNEIKSNIA